MALDYTIAILLDIARETLEERLAEFEESQERENCEAQTIADYLRETGVYSEF